MARTPEFNHKQAGMSSDKKGLQNFASEGIVLSDAELLEIVGGRTGGKDVEIFILDLRSSNIYPRSIHALAR